jgi:putative transposase
VTVKRTPSGKYFVSVLVDDSFADSLPTVIELAHTVGLEHFLTDSEGDKKENPRFFKRAMKHLAAEQKRSYPAETRGQPIELNKSKRSLSSTRR